MDNLTEASVQFVRQTEMAILILDGNKEIWIPKSQINKGDEEPDYDSLTNGDLLEITIPEWLALDKGII